MSIQKRKVSAQHSANTESTENQALKRCALFAAIAGALAAGPAFAQTSISGSTSDDEDMDTLEAEAEREAEAAVAADEGLESESGMLEEVIVSGMRSSLMSSQMLKREADTVIDTITAEDLGSFPDKSIAEALQRVAGITVNRFAASSDTAHFSAEPSGVIVRGLNMVRTEFNGRDSFSANSSRGLSWGDVSPELMAGVDTYKNQMAELIEGGISGTVNMRTRLPFDQADRTFAVSAGANYGDLSEDVTPEVSGLYSDRWVLDGGSEFGVMVNAAYSEVHTRSEGIQLYRMNRFRDIYQPGVVYIPAIINMRDNLYERERTGTSLAAQWASADDTVTASVQYNSSKYDNKWEEYVVGTAPADLSFSQSVFYEIEGQNPGGWDQTAPAPAPGTPPFTFNDQGLFQTGVITTGSGWWGNDNADAATFASNAAGQNMVNACYGWNGCEPQVRGIDSSTVTRSNNNSNETQDLGFNLKWAVTDSIRTNFDVQFVDSEVQNYDIELHMYTFANTALDLSGGRPTVQFLEPTNVNFSPGAWANPNNYYIRSIMDHVEDSDGDELAVRGDIEIDLDSGWFESVKAGVRYADRDQTVRWSGYNWQNVANVWTGPGQGQSAYFNADSTSPDSSGQTGFTGYPADLLVNRQFNEGFYDGNNLAPLDFVFGNMDFLQDQAGFANAMSASALGLTGGVGWDPICSNTGDRADEIPGTCYTPSEISDVSEVTGAGYVQLNFGGADAELFGIPFSGNIGVRYVETNNKSTGGIAFPMLNQSLFFERIDNGDGTFTNIPLPRAYENLGCYENGTLPDGSAPPVPLTTGCYITQEDYAFMDGADALNTADVDHDHWLPSFNIKFDLNEDWLIRFAWSRAMSRPDIGNLKNYVGVGGTLPSQDNANDPLWVKDANGEIIAADVRYSGGAQNPFLKPVIADQWDISLEYYFADVGSASLAVFKKTFDDYIQFGTYNRTLTNNGVTQVAEIRGPLNGEGAELQGFEVAFQRFFDFLPAPFDGFGIQANYTYIDNKGITNTGVTEVGDGNTVTGQAPDQVSVNRLEGLSDDSYTVIGMYEKGPISVRAAYSWRSEYLVTAIDCCVAYPIWNDDYGQLDASVRWQLSDSWELGLSGSNITNAETRLRQQVANFDDGGLTLPNAWFQNDRRYTLYVRYFSR